MSDRDNVDSVLWAEVNSPVAFNSKVNTVLQIGRQGRGLHRTRRLKARCTLLVAAVAAGMAKARTHERKRAGADRDRVLLLWGDLFEVNRTSTSSASAIIWAFLANSVRCSSTSLCSAWQLCGVERPSISAGFVRYYNKLRYNKDNMYR